MQVVREAAVAVGAGVEAEAEALTSVTEDIARLAREVEVRIAVSRTQRLAIFRAVPPDHPPLQGPEMHPSATLLYVHHPIQRLPIVHVAVASPPIVWTPLRRVSTQSITPKFHETLTIRWYITSVCRIPVF